ncbi:MAG: acyl-CoA carboxylase epsilon subunit [Lapillicoccus sp.]
MTNDPGSSAVPEGAAAGGTQTNEEGAAVVRVLRGQPTPEDLAALLVVLAAAGGGGTGDAHAHDEAVSSRWSAPGTRLRTAYGPGRASWRASGMPR